MDLTKITIPDSVTKIGSCVFSGCISLTKITIPDHVTSIEHGAFMYCKALQSVTYKGTTYTNKTELMNALTANNVVANQDAFDSTALQ